MSLSFSILTGWGRQRTFIGATEIRRNRAHLEVRVNMSRANFVIKAQGVIALHQEIFALNQNLRTRPGQLHLLKHFGLFVGESPSFEFSLDRFIRFKFYVLNILFFTANA